MLVGSVLVALFATIGASESAQRCRSKQPTYPVRMLHGLETQRFDDNTLVIYPGSAVDNTGCAILNVYRSIKVDIDRTGIGGRDNVVTPNDVRAGKDALQTNGFGGFNASYANGTFAGKPLGGWYYIVLAKERGEGASVEAILTRQQSSQRTDGAGSAGVPENFPYRRTLPISFYYDPQSGFRPMYCYGWPKSVCNWTRIKPSERYLIARSESATTPQTIDASKWVPGYGRILRLEIVLHAADQGGGAYVSTLVGTGGEFKAGYVNRAGDRSVLQLELATTSKQTFVIRTDPGVIAEIFAVGFSIEQPS
ncbi:MULTISPECIES: hypothetical protein [unclassified Rhizobium]|uniref:hypothetical protein n=1 Tax=unclassified Rhizobium TaxID=2613769 RepID=UPI001AE45ED6|nr:MULTISPECIES: hypothetical protein [unclassified Rhizobium]MBP2460150.1 hypothetical protein [Rhizobium sp. PvP014]MBP2531509.1 hypothetical protein [Rhizobium sp. PvP099]